MFAIVEFKGMQFQAKEGTEQNLPFFETKVGEKLTLDKVLLLSDNDNVKLAEELKDAKVEAEIIKIGQTPKIGVLKFHAKKRYQKIGSHRQDFVRVKVTKISAK